MAFVNPPNQGAAVSVANAGGRKWGSNQKSRLYLSSIGFSAWSQPEAFISKEGQSITSPFCKSLAGKHLKIKINEKEGQSITSPSD